MLARHLITHPLVDGGLEQHTATAAVSRLTSMRLALEAYAANHILLLVITLFARFLLPGVRNSVDSLSGMWYQWDARWYVQVATHGYHWLPPPAQSDLAFFPLYPAMMHVLMTIVPLSAYEAGLVITNISIVGALYLLHRIVTHDFPADVGERTLIYLALFPTALFFFTTYSEALFLACSLGCIYALRLRRWWLAGVAGMATALTRQVGVLLVVPFVVEYIDVWMQQRRAGKPALSWRDARNLAAVLLIPAGIVTYIAYLQVTFGNGLLFLRAQSAWQRSWALPWVGPIMSVQHVLNSALKEDLRAQNAIDFLFLVGFLSLLLLGVRRLPRSYTLYSAVILVAVVLNPATGPHQPLALLSISRFGLTIFPLFIVLAPDGPP